MKANRKFLHRGDEAVSPVIAVILMVAITVVLAATVYVWVSGFGSSSNSSPAHTMSMTSAGPITFDATGQDHQYKRYTVSSADPSLTYGDIKFTIGGELFTMDETNGCNQEAAGDNAWGACAGSTTRTKTSAVLAGDTIFIACDDSANDGAPVNTDCLTDKDLLILDIEANSVMVTLKVR